MNSQTVRLSPAELRQLRRQHYQTARRFERFVGRLVELAVIAEVAILIMAVMR